MGLFDRWRNAVGAAMAAPAAGGGRVRVLAGDEDLEVVGESAHQATLRAICAGTAHAAGGPGDAGDGEAARGCVRHEVVGVLVPEAGGPGEGDAIAVHVDGAPVGHLPAGTAAEYLPGLRALMAQAGGHIALPGAVVACGAEGGAPGRLDVWLHHDPVDFGVGTRGPVEQAPWPVAWGGTIRRAELTEPWATDPLLADAAVPAWLAGVPAGEAGIPALRRLLARGPAPDASPPPGGGPDAPGSPVDPAGEVTGPIDRHRAFVELERRLYRLRPAGGVAPNAFEEACRRHDAEAEAICAAFRARWGTVPLLEAHRQMVVRQQRRRRWEACLWWAERALALYGAAPGREAAVEELRKRRHRALAEVEAAAGAPTGATTGA